MEKRKKVAVIASLIGIGLAGGLLYYIYYTSKYVTSDAVFVRSDTLTQLSFKLPGKVVELKKGEGDPVKKGEVIARLETTALRKELEGVNGEINATFHQWKALQLEKEKLESELNYKLQLLQSQEEGLKAEIAGKLAKIGAQEAQLAQAQRDYLRFKRLVAGGKIAREKYEQVATKYRGLSRLISGLKKEVEGLKWKLKALQIQEKIVKANFKEVKRLEELAKAQKAQLEGLKGKRGVIEKHIADSYLRSPIDGVVAKKFISPGEVVGAGIKIVAVVNPKKLYLIDLLEDRKIEGVKPGCPVTITIDGVPGKFKGVVEKVLPVSASTFALLPRDFSSGEFTKLAQRFYVRIKFITPPKGVLVGMGGEVRIERR